MGGLEKAHCPHRQSPPYLLASVRAQAARACPVVLWLPGVVGWWEPSVGHLLSAGQLSPAELLICLLVHHKQLSLPLHSLDPLYHLEWVGSRTRSAANTPGSTWIGHHLERAPLPARHGSQRQAGRSWPAGQPGVGS